MVFNATFNNISSFRLSKENHCIEYTEHKKFEDTKWVNQNCKSKKDRRYNVVHKKSLFVIYSFGLPIWYLQTFYARFKTELVVI
jgi:hypothetical protein